MLYNQPNWWKVCFKGLYERMSYFYRYGNEQCKNTSPKVDNRRAQWPNRSLRL